MSIEEVVIRTVSQKVHELEMDDYCYYELYAIRLVKHDDELVLGYIIDDFLGSYERKFVMGLGKYSEDKVKSISDALKRNFNYPIIIIKE